MNHEQQEVAEQIRSGTYFTEARSWYQALYIGPISERSFFLVVAVLAGLVAFVGVIAFTLLMPLTTRPAILVGTGASDQQIPAINRIRPKGQALETALERFLLQEYVERRESYNAQEYHTNFAFVRGNSAPSVYTTYEAMYGAANPRSPATILGAAGKRIARVDTISLTTPGQVVIKFSTELEGVGTQPKSQWTATLTYAYSPMQTTEVTDPTTGDRKAAVEDPKFRVESYAVSQTP